MRLIIPSRREGHLKLNVFIPKTEQISTITATFVLRKLVIWQPHTTHLRHLKQSANLEGTEA
jgi:hypothetical protein